MHNIFAIFIGGGIGAVLRYLTGILCINYLKLFRLNGEKSIMFLIYITLIIGIIKGEILNSGIFLTGLMYITKTFEEENVNEKRLP